MPVKLPPFPQPLKPDVRRFNADGTPTAVQVEYEAKMARYLQALAGAEADDATAAAAAQTTANQALALAQANVAGGH